MSKRPRDEQDDDRMEFLLTLRRRGISDQAVLRAMDEVPREQFVEAGFRRQRLCRPGAADRMRADHQPALCRRLHDRAAGVTAAPSRAGGGHRLGLSGRRAVAAGARGGEHRALPHARRAGARAVARARLRQCRGRRSATALPACRRKAPYDRIIVTAAAEQVPQTLVDQLADDGVMILPLGPHGGSQHIIKLTKSQTGVARENLIAVRFVPLLPGQAQEL